MGLLALADQISTDWRDILVNSGGYLNTVEDTLGEGALAMAYPPPTLVFRCFDFFDFKDTKVVILGQDPYIKKGEAMGLCFSVPDDVRVPPSLRNIYKELSADVGVPVANKNGDLTRWAEKGVLLLNAALTVEPGKSGSHMKAWRVFTDYIIAYISDKSPGAVVFVLWGGFARSKKKLIDTTRHTVLEAVHPSPLSANRGGFFGCRHFSRCNEALGEAVFE